MKSWSKKYKKCQNCGTTRFKHEARGYCTRCYRLIRKLENVRLWDPSDIRTLKGFPRDMIFRKPEVFEKVKASFTSQIEDRLEYLRAVEERLAGPIYGINIEHKLRLITRLCCTRDKNLFFGIAGYMDGNFDMKQKKILYELLNRIEEDIPWSGVDWRKVFPG